VIAPYSLLQRDRERWLQAKWHLVVLDEAQNIKNASTHAAQVVGKLQSRHRLCLSGTPMENHLGEIWSLFHFLMPGFLGSQKRFTEVFRTPSKNRATPNDWPSCVPASPRSCCAAPRRWWRTSCRPRWKP
jgi:SNF2 family DNA or RNA helicase